MIKNPGTHVLVSTPTGRIGSHLLRRLQSRSSDVRLRVFTRTGARLPPTFDAETEVVLGDLQCVDDLTLALQGVETFFFCIPALARAEDTTAYYRGMGASAAAAVKRANVARVVFVSSAGRKFEQPAGFISALHAVEDLLAEAAADCRFLRCGSHLETLLEQLPAIRSAGAIMSPLDGDLALPRVAVADIAEVAASLLLDTTWSGRAGVPVLGAEDASSKDVARVMGEAIGRPLEHRQVPLRPFVDGLVQRGHVSPSYAASLAETFEAIAAGLYGTEPRTLEATTRTTVAAWAAETLRSRL